MSVKTQWFVGLLFSLLMAGGMISYESVHVSNCDGNSYVLSGIGTYGMVALIEAQESRDQTFRVTALTPQAKEVISGLCSPMI
jgi:hypothetical protein